MPPSTVSTLYESFQPGAEVGTSDWVRVDQEMINRFGDVTLDPDPMHVNPDWARQHSPFGATISFGFLTVALLTNLLHSALRNGPHPPSDSAGYYLNYGFDRLRLLAPVPVNSTVRGHFRVREVRQDARQRIIVTFACEVEIQGSDKMALVADWLSMWVPGQE